MTAIDNSNSTQGRGRKVAGKPSAARSKSHRLQRGPLTSLGSALKSSITLLCSLAALAAATAIIDPATIRAAMEPAQSRDGGSLARHEFALTLANLVNGSHEVLAITPATRGARTEIVIWLRDEKNPGVIDASELAVISHSPLFETVTVYAREEQRYPRANVRTSQPAPQEALTFGRRDISQTGFCDRWRSRSDVGPRVLGAGISDVRIDAVSGGPADLSLLRLSLRWTGDSSDGAGEASALLKLKGGQRSVLGSQLADPPTAESRKPNATNDFRQE